MLPTRERERDKRQGERRRGREAGRLVVAILLRCATLALVLIVLTVLQHLHQDVDIGLDGGSDDGSLKIELATNFGNGDERESRTCFVSKEYLTDSVWLPYSKAKVAEDEAQLQISVKRCSEMSSCIGT